MLDFQKGLSLEELIKELKLPEEKEQPSQPQPSPLFLTALPTNVNATTLQQRTSANAAEKKQMLLEKLQTLELNYVEKIIATQIAKKVRNDHKAKLDKQKGRTNLDQNADLVGIIHHGYNNTTCTNEVLTDYVFSEQDEKNPLSSRTFQQAQRLQFQGKPSYEPNYFQVQETKVQFQLVEQDGNPLRITAKLSEPFTAADQYFYQQYLDAEVNAKRNPGNENTRDIAQPEKPESASTIINNIRAAHRELYNDDGILATTEFNDIFDHLPRDEVMLTKLIKHAQEKTTSGDHNRTYKAIQAAGYVSYGLPTKGNPIFKKCWDEVTKPKAKNKQKKIMVSNNDEEKSSQAGSSDSESDQQPAQPKYSNFVESILNIAVRGKSFIGEDGVKYNYSKRDIAYYAKYLQRLEADLNKVEQHVAKIIAKTLREEHRKSLNESNFNRSNLAFGANLLEIIKHGTAIGIRTHNILIEHIDSKVPADLANSHTFQRALALNMVGVPGDKYFQGMRAQKSFLSISEDHTNIECELPEPFNGADKAIYQQYLNKVDVKVLFDPKFINERIQAEMSAELNVAHKESMQDEWANPSYSPHMSFYDKLTHAEKPKFFTGGDNRFRNVLMQEGFFNIDREENSSAVFQAEWNMQRALPNDTAKAIIAKIKAKHAQLYQGSGFFKSSTFNDVLRTLESHRTIEDFDHKVQLKRIIAHAQKTGPLGGRNRTFEAMQALGYLDEAGKPSTTNTLFVQTWQKLAQQGIVYVYNKNPSGYDSDRSEDQSKNPLYDSHPRGIRKRKTR